MWEKVEDACRAALFRLVRVLEDGYETLLLGEGRVVSR